jgi:hypothetical protein
VDPELFSQKLVEKPKNWDATSLQTKKGDYYFKKIQHNLFKFLKNIFNFE